MTEVWRDIPGLEGAYQASTLGNIRSLRRRVPGRRGLVGGVQLRPHDNGRYLRVSVNGKTRLVHQLVLETFKGPRPNVEAEGRHLDGNSKHNASSNLDWGSASQNQNDRFAHGTACEGENNYRATLTVDQVQQIVRLRSTHGPTAIAKAVGCERHLVKSVVYGQSWNWLTGLPRNRHQRVGACING